MLGYNPIQIYGHMLRSHYILPHIYTQEQYLRCPQWVVTLISCVKPTHFDQYSTVAVLDSLCGQIDLHNQTFWNTQSMAVKTFHAAIRNETKIECDKYDISVILRHDWFWDVSKKNLFLTLWSFSALQFASLSWRLAADLCWSTLL